MSLLRLAAERREQQAEAAKPDAATCLRRAKRGRQVAACLPPRQANLKELGYGK